MQKVMGLTRLSKSFVKNGEAGVIAFIAIVLVLFIVPAAWLPFIGEFVQDFRIMLGLPFQIANLGLLGGL